MGGTTYTYAYNGLGDRVSQTVGEVTTTYTLDLNAGLTQVLADGTNTYLYGYERIAQFSATETGYYLGDALNSVRQMTDEDGVVTLTNQYEPYGDVLSSTGSGASMYGFDGEQTDSYIKLIYLRSRIYFPLSLVKPIPPATADQVLPFHLERLRVRAPLAVENRPWRGIRTPFDRISPNFSARAGCSILLSL